jgi:hypothetical protein
VINPITAERHVSFVLVDGRHRDIGSRYSVTVDRTTTLLVLKRDDERHISATVVDEHGRWVVDVDVTRGRLPQVELEGRVDLTAVIRDEGTPGCLASVLGGPGVGRAVIDLTALDGRRDSSVDVSGRANRFRGAARADLHTTTTTWNVDGALSLRARGLGRVVVLVVGRRLRRSIEEWLEQLWRTSDERMADSQAALRELAGMTEREGGAAAFVRRALWDPHFDPRPPARVAEGTGARARPQMS